jgi:hypothetical protein
MDDIEQDLVISREEIESCGCISDACVADENSLPNSFLDLHVQVWNYHTSGSFAGKWMLMDQYSSSGMRVYIDATSGDITIRTGGTQGSYRVLIMA